MAIKTIDEALSALTFEQGEQFIPTRYPYTYATDFLRQHPSIVPHEVLTSDRLSYIDYGAPLSRSAASRIREEWARLTGIDDMGAAILLADAYLAERGIAVGRDELVAGLAGRKA